MWFKILELFASLSILIVLHELGHFLTAKYFKVRVEKFYLFFDFLFPFPDKMNFSLFKKKIGDTEYGIGWFPMGGYVQMSGIMDESMDKDALAQPVQPYEFRAKPAWQRLIILLGGIIVNVLLAFVIYTGMSYTWGDDNTPVENVVQGLYVDSLAQTVGLQLGDKIVAIEGKEVIYQDDVRMDMVLDLARNITVERDGKTFEIDGLSDAFYGKMLNQRHYLIDPAFQVIIKEIFPDSKLNDVGIKAGDEIISFNGKPIKYYTEFKLAVKNLEIDDKINVNLGVLRNGEKLNFTTELGSEKVFGFSTIGLKTEHKDYNFGEAIIAGPVKTWKTFTGYLKQFKLIFNSEIKGFKQVGGFAAIGGMFPDKAHFSWYSFWGITAFLSIMLAFLNLLPIPALDGGHALFTTWEMVTGKPANEKFMEYAQMVGMMLLFGLLIFANGNDLVKYIMDKLG